jgi:hypothetical protein
MVDAFIVVVTKVVLLNVVSLIVLFRWVVGTIVVLEVFLVVALIDDVIVVMITGEWIVDVKFDTFFVVKVICEVLVTLKMWVVGAIVILELFGNVTVGWTVDVKFDKIFVVKLDPVTVLLKICDVLVTLTVVVSVVLVVGVEKLSI